MCSKVVRRVLAVAFALASASVAGCSEGGSDSDAGAGPPSAGPTVPVAMSSNDVKGARAFIRYYWAVANHAQGTGDTSMLEKLASAHCRPCAEQVSRIEQVHAEGGTISGGTHTVQGQQPLAQDGDPSTYAVIVDLKTTKQVVTETEGADPVTEKRAVATLRFEVRYDEGQWLMNGWQPQGVE